MIHQVPEMLKPHAEEHFYNVSLRFKGKQGDSLEPQLGRSRRVGRRLNDGKNRRMSTVSWCSASNSEIWPQPLTAIWVMQNRLFSRTTPERETEERGSDRTAMECWDELTTAQNCPLLDD